MEPQCSYMYGGLGDLRRQPYLLKSPLKEKTVASSHNRPESAAPKTVPQWYCDAATFAAKLHAASPSGAVKVNPLLAGSRESGGEAAFHGQMSKIRRTKEREMVTAIMEVASHGKMILSHKCRDDADFLFAAKKETQKSRLQLLRRKKKRSGPFILRSHTSKQIKKT